MGGSTKGLGALSGSRPTDQAPAGLGGSRFDPARWQPIETAPKDGTDVLLYARIRQYSELGPIDDDHVVIAGWFESGPFDQQWYDIYSGPFEPTHWMPLPEPPESGPGQ